MASKYSTQYLSESYYDQWDQFVFSSSFGSVYNSARYLDILCQVTGGTFKILAVLDNEQIVGGVALFEKSKWYGTIVSPRSLLYYNGIVLRDYASDYSSKVRGRHVGILGCLERELSSAGYARLWLKNTSTLDDIRIFDNGRWSAKVTYTYIVQLQDLKKLWSGIEQNLRRLVTRSEKHMLEFTCDDDFDSFYRLHHDAHVNKKFNIYLPRDQFKKLFQLLIEKGLCLLYHARLPNEKTIAAQLVLVSPHTATQTVCAASDQAYLKLGTSAFLRWKVFEDLSKLGFITNDLTDAALNPVSHFKSQLGAELKVCFVVQIPDSNALRIRNNLSRIGGRLKSISSKAHHLINW